MVLFSLFSAHIFIGVYLYEVPIGIIVLLSIFYGSISIIAVIGNSLVIWIVATTRAMQTVTNLFIANLALADVVIGMFVIPFQVFLKENLSHFQQLFKLTCTCTWYMLANRVYDVGGWTHQFHSELLFDFRNIFIHVYYVLLDTCVEFQWELTDFM